MKTTEAVKGQWGQVFEYFGLPPITGNHHFKGECPVCSGKSKFRIDDTDGTGSWICVCGSGDGWKLLELTQCKDFKTLAAEIDTLIGNQYDKQTRQDPVKKSEPAAMRGKVTLKYPTLKFLRGTDGEQYLRNRGINCLPADSVRYCDHQRTSNGMFQSIYSLATDSKGSLCYLHMTLLDGDHKAKTGTQKKLHKLQEDSYLEHASSIAIRLFPVSSTLGIAEGIETALSCKQIYNCNTWAVLNTSLMKRFKAPKGVRHLIIFADTDLNGAGHAAAWVCGHRNVLSNNDVERVTIRWPAIGDFNDMIMNGAVVYEWPLLRTA
ncbi:putative prophage DNA primase [Yersinia pseudotuberculosis]|uniref:toprim domain-containing protein n=1 Tax=Yersinia pseudotuberculosis TaxID=633 RepID=UPI00040ADA3D|nr:toprim domain-containing protein [Yersinia pseudotuberculosis]BET62238.1 primase-helicase zinc-binding domain-containing protein [Yersinia pseudotuberculosis]CNK59045.1 putative prophage DNA primase [Yersinia pseudotuberculosis]